MVIATDDRCEGSRERHSRRGTKILQESPVCLNRTSLTYTSTYPPHHPDAHVCRLREKQRSRLFSIHRPFFYPHRLSLRFQIPHAFHRVCLPHQLHSFSVPPAPSLPPPDASWLTGRLIEQTSPTLQPARDRNTRSFYCSSFFCPAPVSRRESRAWAS